MGRLLIALLEALPLATKQAHLPVPGEPERQAEPVREGEDMCYALHSSPCIPPRAASTST